MFTKSAQFYDAIYFFKDYAAEAKWLDEVIVSRLGQGEGRSILDVACGTGAHISYLKAKYRMEGVDKERALIRIAQDRNPDVPIEYGDMAGFELPRRFDVVMCLFSSIGYAVSVPKLQRTLANFAKHLAPGGLVIVEPWIMPEKFQDKYFGLDTVDRDDLKIARASFSRNLGERSSTEFHYLIATSKGIERMEETHELGLFSDAQYREAFRLARLSVERLDEGLVGRGVYVGQPT